MARKIIMGYEQTSGSTFKIYWHYEGSNGKQCLCKCGTVVGYTADCFTYKPAGSRATFVFDINKMTQRQL